MKIPQHTHVVFNRNNITEGYRNFNRSYVKLNISRQVSNLFLSAQKRNVKGTW